MKGNILRTPKSSKSETTIILNCIRKSLIPNPLGIISFSKKKFFKTGKNIPIYSTTKYETLEQY